MRHLFFLLSCAALAIVVACGSDSSDPPSSGGEINSQQDAQAFFEAVMPDLVIAFTELSEQLTTFAEKQGGPATVECPEGGSILYDGIVGQAVFAACGIQGASISGELQAFITPISAMRYQGSFSGPLSVGGAFVGQLDVLQGSAEWNNPPTNDTTTWQATVMVGAETFNVSSGGGSASGECDACIGVNAAPEGSPPILATECTGPMNFECTCQTDSGQVLTYFLSGAGCIY